MPPLRAFFERLEERHAGPEGEAFALRELAPVAAPRGLRGEAKSYSPSVPRSH